MTHIITSSDDLKRHYHETIKAAHRRLLVIILLSLAFFSFLAYSSGATALFVLAGVTVLGIVVIHRIYYRRAYARLALFNKKFPEAWKEILETHSVFYRELEAPQKTLFEKRVQIFLADKRVEGIDTGIDDKIRLLVAASGIIPTFAFPLFTYPELHEVLIYSASFSRKFEIGGPRKQDENIEGMVGNGYMNHSLLLSKPALLAGFTGRDAEENVGIHEFVHLLDREDGETDGIPAQLMEHSYSIPWLHLIKKETDKIKRGHSDINPYAITNNAEFLAVVSEYFFSDPGKFHSRHPELYAFLSRFYNQKFAS